MASSDDALRSPATCRPSISMITRSSGESIPLFMHVGVLSIRSSSRRTERLPSHATMYSRSYIHRPATQRSARCCCSLLAEPGKRNCVDMAQLLTSAELSSEPFGDTSAYCGSRGGDASCNCYKTTNGDRRAPGLGAAPTWRLHRGLQ